MKNIYYYPYTKDQRFLVASIDDSKKIHLYNENIDEIHKINKSKKFILKVVSLIAEEVSLSNFQTFDIEII